MKKNVISLVLMILLIAVVLSGLSCQGDSGVQAAAKDLQKELKECQFQKLSLTDNVTRLSEEIRQIKEVQDKEIKEIEEKLVGSETKNDELEAKLAKTLKNPTGYELRKFLWEDPTSKIEPFPGHLEMTHKLVESAARKGIKGFPVIALIKPGRFWYFTGFRTTDEGVVYIIATLDKSVKLIKGEDYNKINNFHYGGVAIIEKIWVFDFD